MTDYYPFTNSADLLKRDLINRMEQAIKFDIQEIENEISSLRKDREGEGKSSMGDKFETSRSMIDAELHRLQIQVGTHRESLGFLQAIEPTSSKLVEKGSLVLASGKWYFLSIPYGKVRIEGNDVYAISLSSPMAKSFSGKSEGEKIQFRNESLNLEKVL